MRDVAAEAGVALRTVSRVVNGEQSVNADLAERVRVAVARLGYRPDERARQLRQGSSRTLGAAVRGTGGVWAWSAEQAARDQGFMTLAASTEDDPGIYGQVIESLCQRRVDGLLVEPIGASTPYLVAEVAAGLPVVAVDRPLEDVEADSVLSDNEGGVEQAVAHLISRGHRRIAYIGDSERIFTGRLRAQAFRGALAASGRATDLVTTGDVGPELVAAGLERMRRGPSPATALVTGNIEITWEMLGQLGSSIREIAVFCFDSIAHADLLAHPVSTVNQDLHGLGRTAIELLIARIADPDRPPQHVVLPVTVSVRASSEVAPFDPR